MSLYQGGLTAVLGVPSFVVTLGGLMSFRGAAFLVADGKTQPVNDEFFQRLGGGYDGGIGVAATWVLAALVIAGLFVRMVQQAPRAPAPRDAVRAAVDGHCCWWRCRASCVLAFAAAMNSYQISSKTEPQGIPIPVLIWAAVAVVLSFIVHRTRFGRYVFAMGGNPDAAALVGIPVKRVTLMLFALLAVLITIAAIVSIARLNAGTNSLGTGMELYVIAAAVIGGTALAGGSGSILGSVLGALIMQSLDSGMLLLDVSIGKRMVIIGQVLIVAVVFDVLYRRRFGEQLMSAIAASEPLVELRDIRKAFGGVHAVDGVSVNLYPGEVVARARPQRRRQVDADEDAGRRVPDRLRRDAHRRADACTSARPADAQTLGIETIYQTLALADNLDSVANLFLGREKLTPWRTLDDHFMEGAGAQGVPTASTRTSPTSACRCGGCRAGSGRWWRSRARCTSTRAS